MGGVIGGTVASALEGAALSEQFRIEDTYVRDLIGVDGIVAAEDIFEAARTEIQPKFRDLEPVEVAHYLGIRDCVGVRQQTSEPDDENDYDYGCEKSVGQQPFRTFVNQMYSPFLISVILKEKLSDIVKVAVLLVAVEAVADYETVFDRIAAVIGFYIDKAAGGLVEEGDDLNVGSAS